MIIRLDEEVYRGFGQIIVEGKKKMKNNKLVIRGGKLRSIEGIKIEDEEWTFLNSDPQLCLKYDKPIYGVRIIYRFGACDFERGTASVYYKQKEKSYSEENSVNFILRAESEGIREIRFSKPVKEIRFDPVDFPGKCCVEQLIFEPIKLGELVEDIVLCLSNLRREGEKAVVLTEELSMTDSSLFAFYTVKGMQEKGMNVVILTKNIESDFWNKYKNSGIPIIKIEDSEENEYRCFDVDLNNQITILHGMQYAEIIFKALKKSGYTKVVINGVASGEYAELLKANDFKVISLIHEMKTYIQLKKYVCAGESIKKYADYIIFPNELVKNDFFKLFPRIMGEYLVKAYGVCESSVLETQEELDLGTIGIAPQDFVIMGSGAFELKNGVDLFVNTALILGKERKGKDIHYIWTGSFDDSELEIWIKDQIKKSGFDRNVHFLSIGQNSKQFKKILKRADIFWDLSREEAFPFNVIYAMQHEVPAVGFRGSGGIETILSDERGVLVDNFNLADAAQISGKLLENGREDISFIKNAKEYVDKLNFKSFIDFLCECIKKEEIINVKKALYGWGGREFYHARQLKEKSFEEKKKSLKKAKRNSIFQKKSGIDVNQEVILLDTAEGSDNVGDEIIMDYCKKACRLTFPNSRFHHIPTHIYDKRAEKLKGYQKILCGTNLIYTRMEDSKQWALPEDISNYQDICLLGVGMQQLGIEQPMSDYSKNFLQYILSSQYLHSVRDEQTKEFLREAGIKNVINTGCPTMWNLTREKCTNIPAQKADNVLTTVTDYMRDEESDAYMLNALKKNYDKVYIWIQGQFDYEYLNDIVDVREYNLIPPSLEELDKVLERDNLDYVGTRLHAGIRSLNYGHRSLIISIDNRARSMAEDTNLPILERASLKEKLQGMIEGKWNTRIILPEKNINLWRNQFVTNK